MSKGAPEFEGGYARVSRALLSSSPDDPRAQLVKSGCRNGDNGCRERKRPEDQEATKGQDQDFDGETSGRRKVSGSESSALSWRPTERFLDPTVIGRSGKEDEDDDTG